MNFSGTATRQAKFFLTAWLLVFPCIALRQSGFLKNTTVEA